MFDFDFTYYFGSISNFLTALLVLIIGWVIALIIANIVKKALMKTTLDDKLFAGPSGEKKGDYHSETIISRFVFWVIMAFAIIAFLNILNLSSIARPFSDMLNSLLSIVPDLILAIILAAAAWVIASTLSFLIRKLGLRLPIATLSNKLGLKQDVQQANKVVDIIANIVFYFVLLLFLPAILST